MMKRVAPLAALAALLLAGPPVGAAPEVQAIRADDRVRLEFGGQLFTEYIFKGGPRPYLYPILAADGTKLNRDFPQVKGVAGEETDHPHHTSLWFTHGAVNGVDFWSVTPKAGMIVNDSVTASTQGGGATIASHNRWVAPGGAVFCTDDTTIRARAIPGGRLLDYEVTLHAPADKPVVFGDTKEGAMAIRLAQWLTAPHKTKEGAGTPTGTIVSETGATDNDTWGKRAKWVDYHGTKDGKVYGVALFDSPRNPRFPTWWHVRDYGLFAANPFGRHDFEGTKEKPLPKDLGDFTIPAGGSVTFRWRFYFHLGDEKAAHVAEHFAEFAAEK